MSAASNPLPKLLTVGEFLAQDHDPTMRFELVDGIMVAMNPPHFGHAQLVQSIGLLLVRSLPSPCRAYWSATGVAESDDGTTWREPDIVVTCVRPDGAYVKTPRMLVEVLSPSTEKDDRTTKLDFYETLPSLEAVLLVWQDERRIRLRSRGAAGWVDQDVIGSGTVAIPGLGVSLSLDEIYADPWDEAAPGEA